MERQSLTLLDPDRYHSLSENVKSIAVAVDNVVSLGHFFLKIRVVGSENIASVRSFN